MAGEDVLRDMVRRKQIKEMMGGGKASSDEAGLEAAWSRGEAVDVDGFEIGPVMLAHVGGAKALTGKWAKAGDLLKEPSKALCIRQKPFWGNLDYQECTELKQTVIDFLRQFF